MSNCIDHGKRGNAGGYAVKMINYKNQYLHRLALATHIGVAVTDLRGVVMHLCNNPRCINPEHLKLGTQAENVQQAHREGRKQTPKVTRKLTFDKVTTIRQLHSDGIRQSELAEQFNVSRPTISDIIHRRTW